MNRLSNEQLITVMIEKNIGVSIKKMFVVKDVDFSYLEGE
jgi:restriction endonuclease Mrr